MFRLQYYGADAWAVLQRFGYVEFFTELNGTGIHRLSNVMTLDSGWHDKFDTLQLWFEPMVGFISLSLFYCSLLASTGRRSAKLSPIQSRKHRQDDLQTSPENSHVL